ncbi:MAG: hypothetical protein EOO59_12620, partial [Hymenobacter sp.]
NPQKNHYAYRLLGYHPDWVRPGPGQRTASFANLPPGRYTLEVTADNGEGAWAKKPATVQFEVLAPWYKTGWAFAAYALLLLGAGAHPVGVVAQQAVGVVVFLRIGVVQGHEIHRKIVFRGPDGQELRRGQRPGQQHAAVQHLAHGHRLVAHPQARELHHRRVRVGLNGGRLEVRDAINPPEIQRAVGPTGSGPDLESVALQPVAHVVAHVLAGGGREAVQPGAPNPEVVGIVGQQAFHVGFGQVGGQRAHGVVPAGIGGQLVQPPADGANPKLPLAAQQQRPHVVDAQAISLAGGVLVLGQQLQRVGGGAQLQQPRVAGANPEHVAPGIVNHVRKLAARQVAAGLVVAPQQAAVGAEAQQPGRESGRPQRAAPVLRQMLDAGAAQVEAAGQAAVGRQLLAAAGAAQRHQPVVAGAKPERAVLGAADGGHVHAPHRIGLLVEVAAERAPPQVVGRHAVARAKPQRVRGFLFINGVDVVVGVRQLGAARERVAQQPKRPLAQVHLV